MSWCCCISKSAITVTETPIPSQLFENRFNIGGKDRRCAKLVRVIDGDTVELSIELPHELVTRDPRSPKLTTWLVFTCRLYGIDAMEKKTKNGKKAITLLQDKINNLSILYVEIHSGQLGGKKGQTEIKEKYGRLLVSIYDSKDAQKTIYDDWLDKHIEGYGIVMETYNGGKKSDYSRQCK